MSDQEFIFAPPTVKVDFEIIPVDNNFNSLYLLFQADELSGFGDWVYRTYEGLSDERIYQNKLVFDVLLKGFEDDSGAKTFPEYMTLAKACNPTQYRNRFGEQVLKMAQDMNDGQYPLDLEEVLANKENFMQAVSDGICTKYAQKGYDTEKTSTLFADAYDLLENPAQAIEYAVEHMQYMWTNHLRDEWRRIEPMLQEAVEAFNQVDFMGKTATEIFQTVTGRRDLPSVWPHLEEVSHLVFMPSAHIGPYVSMYMRDDKTYIVFGARMPEGVRAKSAALSRSELLIRINALADNTRLAILELLTRHDELFAQDIMQMLDLSQSSASRHLRQLTATGFLVERRQDVAKCYSLSMERVEDTLNALKLFFNGQL